MLTCAGRFDGGVQREKVCLLRKVINNFDDFANVIGAMAKNIDDFRGRLNGFVGAIQAVGGLSMVWMPVTTSSRDRLAISRRTFAVSATRWIEVTIWSMEADVSATLEACTCVFFTTFCTLMLISCIVLVTSSMAEEA
jgi:hypothetical protein